MCLHSVQVVVAVAENDEILMTAMNLMEKNRGKKRCRSLSLKSKNGLTKPMKNCLRSVEFLLLSHFDASLLYLIKEIKRGEGLLC